MLTNLIWEFNQFQSTSTINTQQSINMACQLGRFYPTLKESDCRQMDGGANGFGWEYGEGSPEGWLEIYFPEYQEKLSQFRYQTRYRKGKVKAMRQYNYLIGRRLPFLGEIRR